MTALHAGQDLIFRPHPAYGQWPLPQEVEQGVLPTFPPTRPGSGLPEAWRSGIGKEPLGLAAFSSVQVSQVDLRLTVLEPGKVQLQGDVIFAAQEVGGDAGYSRVSHIRTQCVPAVGVSRSLQSFGSRPADLGRIADTEQRISLTPQSCMQVSSENQESGRTPGVTTADVLEALHLATGRDILGDYFTRFYPPDAVTLHASSLAEALSSLSAAMRLRWRYEDDWLQFRGAGFLHDQRAEVPHRLFARWAEARRRSGKLSFEDLVEVASLSDAQLDAPGIADGAQDLYGLEEWDLIRSPLLRPHWRLLGSLPSELRGAAWSERGLRWEDLPVAQHPEFLALATYTRQRERQPDLAFGALWDSLSEKGPPAFPWREADLPGATLHVVAVATEGDATDVAFIYRYGSVLTGFWRREVRCDGTRWRHDALKPLPVIARP
ncbi:MAG TPA: hypothetical protein VKU00_29425 [Chthonomonadaceae bacterium]|nr:hypothetical protein [Chthonomonadaceae bacterium]